MHYRDDFSQAYRMLLKTLHTHSTYVKAPTWPSCAPACSAFTRPEAWRPARPVQIKATQTEATRYKRV
uniref:Uncharacterized protein n=1 Tax=Anguilla anguilla TaxID=7936 RepID=A0A0E9R5V2_ANGAN